MGLRGTISLWVIDFRVERTHGLATAKSLRSGPSESTALTPGWHPARSRLVLSDSRAAYLSRSSRSSTSSCPSCQVPRQGIEPYYPEEAVLQTAVRPGARGEAA
jgi:hypothetical protein